MMSSLRLTCQLKVTLWSVVGSLLFLGNVATAQVQPPAAELQEVSRLIRQGQHQAALDKATAYLSGKPKDPLGRFLKGVAQTELGKPNDAIVTFQALTEDYPELPEPYNNLAVLYAAKGQFEKARSALELAIQTHPSYSTAHENLGDVYAKLASQSYDKALQLDKANPAVQSKLNLLRDIFSTQPTVAPKASSRPDPLKVAAAAPAPTAKPEAPKPEPTKPTEIKPIEAKPVPPPAPVAAPNVAAAELKSAPKVVTKSAADTDGAVNAVKSWAEAWSAQDVDRYLGAYAPSFKPADGASRRAWEESRRERLTTPKDISVKVSDFVVTAQDDQTVEVRFRQNYRSDVVSPSSTRKTLTLVQTGGQWRISRERTGG